MITFRDPPPLEVRVKSLKEPAIAPPTFEAPFGLWAFLLLTLVTTGIVVSSQSAQRTAKESLVQAFSNSLPRQVESGLLTLIPIGTSMPRVRARIDDVHLTCRSTAGVSAGDSVLTCLGLPIVRENTYAQIAIRFGSSRGSLTSVSACPTVVHWKVRAVPSEIVQRLAAQSGNSCWRDATNAADNEWSYSMVPDRAFTVARVHGADTVSRRAAATSDTLLVDW